MSPMFGYTVRDGNPELQSTWSITVAKKISLSLNKIHLSALK